MTKRTIWMLGVCVGAGLLGTGCDRGDTTQGAGATPRGVGVMNLDQVAKDLGWLSDMQRNFDQFDKQLSVQMNQAKADYEDQIAQKRAQLGLAEGEQPTGLQQKQLQPLEDYVREAISRLPAEAGEQDKAYRAMWVQQYREALKPVVREVASDHKVSVVLESSDHLIYNEPSTDLTYAISFAARAQSPTLRALPGPSLQAHPMPKPGETPPATAPATMPAIKTPATKPAVARPAGAGRR